MAGPVHRRSGAVGGPRFSAGTDAADEAPVATLWMAPNRSIGGWNVGALTDRRRVVDISERRIGIVTGWNWDDWGRARGVNRQLVVALELFPSRPIITRSGCSTSLESPAVCDEWWTDTNKKKERKHNEDGGGGGGGGGDDMATGNRVGFPCSECTQWDRRSLHWHRPVTRPFDRGGGCHSPQALWGETWLKLFENFPLKGALTVSTGKLQWRTRNDNEDLTEHWN